jgi:hypothetical protein
MTRWFVLCACLFGVLGWAMAAETATTATTTTMAPMSQPPLRGVVTLLGTDGAFAINLGSEDGLQNKAELLVSRDGNVIGKAKVVSTGILDAQAQMLDAKVTPQTGDTVLVQFNPAPVPLCPMKRLLAPDNSISQRRGHAFITLVLLAATGLLIANN